MQLCLFKEDGQLLGYAKLGRVFTEHNILKVVNKKVQLVNMQGREVAEFFVKLQFQPSGAVSIIQRQFR